MSTQYIHATSKNSIIHCSHLHEVLTQPTSLTRLTQYQFQECFIASLPRFRGRTGETGTHQEIDLTMSQSRFYRIFQISETSLGNWAYTNSMYKVTVSLPMHAVTLQQNILPSLSSVSSSPSNIVHYGRMAKPTITWFRCNRTMRNTIEVVSPACLEAFPGSLIPRLSRLR